MHEGQPSPTAASQGRFFLGPACQQHDCSPEADVKALVCTCLFPLCAFQQRERTAGRRSPPPRESAASPLIPAGHGRGDALPPHHDQKPPPLLCVRESGQSFWVSRHPRFSLAVFRNFAECGVWVTSASHASQCAVNKQASPWPPPLFLPGRGCLPQAQGLRSESDTQAEGGFRVSCVSSHSG